MKKIISIFVSILLIVSFSITAFADSASDLEYSTYLWTPSNYNSINCYGYAIGENVAVDPGYFSAGSYEYSNAITGTQFKNLVVADLMALGYSVRTTTSPSATLSSDEIMIAYYYGGWEGTVGNNDFEERSYHFWVKDDNANWNHKFGRSSGLMRFNYVPKSSNITKVSNEFYNGITGVYQPAVLFANTSTLGGSWGYIIFNYYDPSVVPRSAELLALTANAVEQQDNSIAAVFERYTQSLEESDKQ